MTEWAKKHKPSLGPYNKLNKKVCVDCGKMLDGVPLQETCEPRVVKPGITRGF